MVVCPVLCARFDRKWLCSFPSLKRFSVFAFFAIIFLINGAKNDNATGSRFVVVLRTRTVLLTDMEALQHDRSPSEICSL